MGVASTGIMWILAERAGNGLPTCLALKSLVPPCLTRSPERPRRH
jgi:hypothetical protein